MVVVWGGHRCETVGARYCKCVSPYGVGVAAAVPGMY